MMTSVTNTPTPERVMRPGSKRRVWLCLSIAWLVINSGSFMASEQPATTEGRQSFSAFTIITDRNIFSPRRSRSSRGSREPQRIVRSEDLSLVGTMSYEKGVFAFFEGNRSEFQKVVKPSEDIAGFTVAEITSSAVRLTQGTNEVRLPVGSYMRKPDGGDWQLAGATVASGGSSFSAARSARTGTFIETELTNGVAGVDGEPQVVVIDSSTQTVMTVPENESGTNGAVESASGDSDDPVLRRLMQRREQELNR